MVEPNPDARFMELMLARCCDDQFCALLQGFLADAAVSLIIEFLTLRRKLFWFHELSHFLLFALAPFGSFRLVSLSPTATLFITIKVVHKFHTQAAALVARSFQYQMKEADNDEPHHNGAGKDDYRD